MADSSDAVLLKRRARRRLVGAIALVVLVVVILPVILDQQPRTVTQPLTVRIPSQDSGPFDTPVLPAQQSPKTAPGGEAQGGDKNPDRSRAVDAPKPRAPVKKTARNTESKRAKADEQEARRASALLGEDAYVVPLGAFTHSDNAKQVREKAASVGIQSYTETIKVAQGESTRVRAGPFPSRATAEKARQKLKSLGIDVGQVVQR